MCVQHSTRNDMCRSLSLSLTAHTKGVYSESKQYTVMTNLCKITKSEGPGFSYSHIAGVQFADLPDS